MQGIRIAFVVLILVTEKGDDITNGRKTQTIDDGVLRRIDKFINVSGIGIGRLDKGKSVFIDIFPVRDDNLLGAFS